jgi:uncharacterized protein (TIGR03437 family)
MRSRFRLWQVIALGVWGCAVAGAQTSIFVAPEELSFAAPARSATRQTATLTLLTTGGNSPFTAGVRYLGLADGWLAVTPSTGTTPTTLTVTADASRLDAGTYLGQVTIQAGNLGRVVNVFLSVGSGGTASTFSVSPSPLIFTNESGQAGPLAQGITVTAPGSTAGVNFRVTSSAPAWLVVSPLPSTTPATVTVEVYPANVPAGVHTASLTVTPVPAGIPTVVPVTFISTGTSGVPDTIELSQTALSLTHQVGTADPPIQQVAISTTAGFREYTAATMTRWIKLVSDFNPTPASSVTDFAPGFFSIDVDPTGLAAGTYIGTVTVSSTGLANVQLPVSLRVTTTPALNAQPSSITLDDQTSTEASVVITSTGFAALSFNAAASSSGNWLSVSPTTGSTAFGAQTLVIRGSAAALTAGNHTGSVIVTAQNGESLTIPVRFRVNATTSTGDILWLPEEVSLTGVAGRASPLQSVDLRTDTGLAHDFLVSAQSTGGWLKVDQLSGTTPARLTVSANIAAAPGTGTHEGSILVTSLLNRQQYTIPVTLNVVEETITADPASITFTQPQRGAQAPTQTLTITGPVPTTFRVVEAPPWVRVSSSSGNTPATLTVWSELALVPPGTNNSNIQIAGPKNQVNVPVNFVFAEVPQPTVTPASVSLNHVLGAPAPTQNISVDTGGAPGTFTVSARTDTGVDWLSVSPTSGATPGTIALSVATDRLVPGDNSGTITLNISANDTTYTRMISVVVKAGRPANTIHSVLHGATLLPSAVAPGLILTITGSGLGPASGVAARPTSAGSFDTILSDVRVTFDGAPAPLLYVREDQINAIAPYSLQGRLNTRVRVERGENWSLPVELRVVDAAPGFFTAGGTGRGQAAAMNADLTMNSAATPAPRGSVITLFGTGEGQTDPGGQDGRIIATDIRRPLLPVTARVAGRPAEVLYAGSAPTQVSGLFQINLRIPEDTPPGTVPLEIQVGSAPSQPGLTIAVQ